MQPWKFISLAVFASLISASPVVVDFGSSSQSLVKRQDVHGAGAGTGGNADPAKEPTVAKGKRAIGSGKARPSAASGRSGAQSNSRNRPTQKKDPSSPPPPTDDYPSWASDNNGLATS